MHVRTNNAEHKPANMLQERIAFEHASADRGRQRTGHRWQRPEAFTKQQGTEEAPKFTQASARCWAAALMRGATAGTAWTEEMQQLLPGDGPTIVAHNCRHHQASRLCGTNRHKHLMILRLPTLPHQTFVRDGFQAPNSVTEQTIGPAPSKLRPRWRCHFHFDANAALLQLRPECSGCMICRGSTIMLR